MIGADVAALVRVQEGPAAITVQVGEATAKRFVRSRLHVSDVAASAWRPKFALNWIIASKGESYRRVAFFARGKFLGTDYDFGDIGQLGQVGPRSGNQAEFALTLFRSQDRRCCPMGRTIDARFRWNGTRLVETRSLLREGVEPAEGVQLPSRNIGCIFSRSPRYVRCDVRSGLKPAPPRPAGCDLDWAYGLQMTPVSKPKTFCAGDTALAQGPILAYGATLRIEGFTCLSQRSGLRCTNRAGHGFFLSRQRQRVF
jgi:LppP/LprE lipoprotein